MSVLICQFRSELKTSDFFNRIDPTETLIIW
jgi:hypothetical protein